MKNQLKIRFCNTDRNFSKINKKSVNSNEMYVKSTESGNLNILTYELYESDRFILSQDKLKNKFVSQC